MVTLPNPEMVIRGSGVLKDFHNRMIYLYEGKYTLSFDALCEYLTKLNSLFLDGLGRATTYNSSGVLTPQRITKSMEGLANASQGNLPVDFKGTLVFTDALYELTTPSLSLWKVATQKAVVETATQVKGLAFLGLGTTAVVALAALAGYVFLKTR